VAIVLLVEVSHNAEPINS